MNNHFYIPKPNGVIRFFPTTSGLIHDVKNANDTNNTNKNFFIFLIFLIYTNIKHLF